MIYGNIYVRETEAAYTDAIRKAIAILRETDFEGMEPGKYEIDGDKLFVQVNQAKTGPKEEKRPEVHKQYIDVQYMVRGRELIGFYPDDRSSMILEDNLATNDVLFYKENPKVNEIMLPMFEGNYAIFFPEDVHRPFCQFEETEEVKKVVIKVRVDSL